MDKILEQRLSALRALNEKSNAEAKKDPTKPVVVMASDELAVESIPTGSPVLDGRLGGGWPKGKMVTIYGAWSTGKSALAYTTIAEMHRRDPLAVALLFDAENSFDIERGKALGMDQDRLVILRPMIAEEGLQKVREYLDVMGPDGKPIIDLVVVDSVALLTPRAEYEGETGDSNMALIARMMNQFTRQLMPVCERRGITFIWLNQIREKPGVTYGNPEVRPGGRALDFASTVMVRTGNAEKIKEGDEEVALIAKVTVQKNKYSGYRGVSTILLGKNGLELGYEIYDAGVKVGLVEKRGNALSVQTPDGELKGPGKAAFIKAVNEASSAQKIYLYDELVKRIKDSRSGFVQADPKSIEDPDGISVDPALAADESAEAAAA